MEFDISIGYPSTEHQGTVGHKNLELMNEVQAHRGTHLKVNIRIELKPWL